MAQTTVKDSKTIRFGSGKLEVGATVGTLVDLGAMKGIKFTEELDKVSIMSDNAGEVYAGIRNHKATVEGDLIEINLTNLNTLRGGIDTYATVPAAAVNGHSYVVASGAWKYNVFIELDFQNGDLSKITPTSVTAGTDGLLTLDTDYVIVQDAGTGHWGIVVIDSLKLTKEAQTLTILFDYTPNAAKTLTSGGKLTITPNVVRITNTDANDKVFRITVYKATNAQGIELELQSDDAEDPNVVPIKLEGVLDVSRIAGDQLFEIYDEQGA